MNIDKLCQVTSLSYCDEDCPCGDNNRLLWEDDETPEWLPGWANGVNPDTVWRWMLEQADPLVVAAVAEVNNENELSQS